ncbi:TatD family hydrolase [Neisseria montereyensis]|uniref:TatD family hydrolase n=1 Tax=Neisseria montereyensis TaxID=2973938 RepID=A0ABT2FHS6_9NEIS|nr:TatD family hydrolase [Neisseria montereyensis]MCS4534753.1 TatD family hydrolase [Neisseria montereyensis]
MLKLTDTHCHLADPAFSNHLPDILKTAESQGVRRFIVPATCSDDFQAVISLTKIPSVHIALGIHPWFAESASEQDFHHLESLLKQYPQAWVGEIGLDFYDKAQTTKQREKQIDYFCRQLVLAERLHRPVIVHNLKATSAIVEAVKQSRFSQGGIAHAFSGSLEEAQLLIKNGFKIGIGSLLLNPTAKKARQAAQNLPLKDMVLETDSPFMLKNTLNTPANVRQIAEITAELRHISLEEVATATEQNVETLLATIPLV